jgi:hypothetical protein
MLLDRATDEQEIAELQFWLWKLSHREEYNFTAITCYESLYARIPNVEFGQRLAELRGEQTAKSTEGEDVIV